MAFCKELFIRREGDNVTTSTRKINPPAARLAAYFFNIYQAFRHWKAIPSNKFSEVSTRTAEVILKNTIALDSYRNTDSVSVRGILVASRGDVRD